MTDTRRCCLSALLLICFALPLSAQQPALTATNAIVPPLVNFSGVLTDVNGKPLTGTIGVTFSLYKDQQGGAPLWLETQNAKPNATGHYTVMLGSTTSQGIPANIFASGEAHWLGVQVQGQAEKARVLLLSVPYALKAGDAESLGGKPASAYMTVSNSPASGSGGATVANNTAPTSFPALSGGGTKDYVPLWLSKTKLGNSNLFQSAAGNLGIGTKTPSATLDVNGDVNAATSYNLGGLPFAFGSFAGQNAFFGFAGNSKMTGTRNTASGWDALLHNTTGSTDTASGYQALLSNTTGNNNTASGSSALQANTTGGNNIGIGSAALLSNTTGNNNTASGSSALQANSTGSQNTATGQVALQANTTGSLNTASGAQALYFNTTGSQNTANGFNALIANTTGSFNAALGFYAGQTVDNSNVTGSTDTAVGAGAAFGTGSISNATAVGANAVVSASNALVLGCIGGVNNCNSNVNVGIGTATPASTLDVHGTANITGNQTVNGSLTATSFSGNGSGVTNVNASDLGGLASSAFAQLAANNTFTGAQSINNTLAVSTSGNAGALQVANAQGFGINGQSPNVGVYGTASGASSLGGEHAGVWGDTGGTSDEFAGVLGTASDNNAGSFNNNSGSDTSIGGAALLGANLSSTTGALAFVALGGATGDACTIDIDGNLKCSGTVSELVQGGGARRVTVYAMLSPENWFEDFGSGTLVDGAAIVVLDPAFARTVNTTAQYHIFLTPSGDCKGLFVSQRSAESFEIRELGGGRLSIAFDYRIVAKRNGHEDARLTDVTEQYQKMIEQEQLRREGMAQRRAAGLIAGAVRPHHK